MRFYQYFPAAGSGKQPKNNTRFEKSTLYPLLYSLLNQIAISLSTVLPPFLSVILVRRPDPGLSAGQGKVEIFTQGHWLLRDRRNLVAFCGAIR